MTLREEATYERSRTVGFHLYEQPAMGKSIQTGSRLVVARGRERGGMGNHCSTAVGFPLGVTENSRMRCGDDYTTLFT